MLPPPVKVAHVHAEDDPPQYPYSRAKAAAAAPPAEMLQHPVPVPAHTAPDESALMGAVVGLCVGIGIMFIVNKMTAVPAPPTYVAAPPVPRF